MRKTAGIPREFTPLKAGRLKNPAYPHGPLAGALFVIATPLHFLNRFPVTSGLSRQADVRGSAPARSHSFAVHGAAGDPQTAFVCSLMKHTAIQFLNATNLDKGEA